MCCFLRDQRRGGFGVGDLDGGGHGRRHPGVREARFDDFYPEAYAAMAAVDAQGVITGWGAGAQRLFGYKPAEVTGRSAAELLAADLPDAAGRSAAALEAWSGQVALQHQDGRILDVELWAYPLVDNYGKVQWFLIAASEELRRREETRTLVDRGFDQSPMRMLFCDTDLRVLRVNAVLCQALGMEEDDARGLFLTDLMPGPAAELAERQMARVVRSGEPVVFEIMARSPDRAHENVWSVGLWPVKDPTGRLHGVVEAVTDISEQHWARKRLALLNEASTRIGSTLDVTRTVEELADLAVPRLADWASVDLLDSVLSGGEPVAGPLSGSVTLNRTAHQSVLEGCPEAVVELGTMETHPEFSPLARVVATGRSRFYRVTDPDLVAWITDSPPRAARIRDFGFHSIMVVPLRARGTTLGAVMFARHRRPEPFEQDDLILAEDLCARAALSIDNARRYTRERTTAVTLQRSLLPQGLPAQTAVEVASRYLPAGSGVGVGGDWYDVIPLSGARVALVVGDVVGHGIHAAATMGRLRTAVRTLADVDLAPDELLTRLDDVVIRLSAEENTLVESAVSGMTTGDIAADDIASSDIAATCLYAVYDPVSRICSMARAGHPPPAVVTPDGTVDFLDVPAGPPLGFGGLPFEAWDIQLPEGSLLVLYSDGLLKSHGRDIDTGLGELRGALTGPVRSLATICDTVLATLLPDRPTDDVALLVARTRALDAGQVASWGLSDDPAIVAHARAQASRQLTVWGLDEATFTTELVVSELVTNAIRHARIPIELRLILDSGIICEVSDASSTAPHLRRAHSFDEGGRGLFLVAQLTTRWGTRHTRSGKTIWAEQPLPTG